MDINKILKASKSVHAARLSESKLFNNEACPTPVPIVNLALSGDFEGGIDSGLLMLAGPSKHFKSNLALMMAAAYLNKHEDATLVFVDTEFGSKESYFRSFGIDPDRVAHIPAESVEDIRTDLKNIIETIERKDKAIIVIDSIGNAASNKEIEDAGAGKNKADMQRAKVIKSTFRIITPMLKIRDIPCIAINHTYQTMEMFSKTVASGGTGIYYSSDDVWILGRRQAEEDKTAGYDFVINIDKSRTVREKSQFIFSVRWNGGIDVWSGMFNLAKETNFIVSPKQGWYQACDPETGELFGDKMLRKKELDSDFWKWLITNTEFSKVAKDLYRISDAGLELDQGESDEDEA